jgi:hypothetical protein
MSEYERCEKCHKWDWIKRHKCPPKWYAVVDGYNDEDDPGIVYARTAEDAATGYADENFAALEYPDDVEVWVRESPDDPWQKFDVSVESIPSFSATPKE